MFGMTTKFVTGSERRLRRDNLDLARLALLCLGGAQPSDLGSI
jgi:hypothetical protein